jgi:hypothetical protein
MLASLSATSHAQPPPPGRKSREKWRLSTTSPSVAAGEDGTKTGPFGGDVRL